ncbi:MAG: DUF2796 domain-containing protein [Litorilituus sp.]|jgi:hypothetical protein|nr:DUF2796 domain-containing protein [Litorilituus sp.]
MHALLTIMCKISLLIYLIITSPSIANEHSNHSQNAHVHGLAQLTLAIETNYLLISLTAPAYSLVGFEHRAQTPEEIAKLNKIKKTFTEINNIITLSKASCKLINTHINMDALLPLTNDVNNNHTFHTEHTEVIIDYTLHCLSLTDISSAAVTIFEYHPNIKKISAIWVTDSQQGAVSLTATENVLSWQ